MAKEFPCMLGKQYKSRSKINFPVIVTEKLDGVRRLLFIEKGELHFFSRSGIEDVYSNEILEEAQFLPSGYVYDGELIAIGTFRDSLELRQETTSRANIKRERSGLSFNIFDMIPIDDFRVGYSKYDNSFRKVLLHNTLAYLFVKHNLKLIREVPFLGIAHNKEMVDRLAQEVWNRGGEGLMLSVMNAPYIGKRTDTLLKIKRTEDFTVEIVSYVEGNGKLQGMLGAFLCKFEDNIVEVGTGYSEELRKQYWQEKDQLLHKFIEVEAFGKSRNKNGTTSLNCPVFKRFVGEE